MRNWFFNAPPSHKFPNGDHHLKMRDVNERFQEVLIQLKIPAGKKNGGFTQHSLRSSFKTIAVNANIPREVVDACQGHAGHRPTASDAYYKLSDAESQRFMELVPFGDGEPAADAGANDEEML